MCGISGAFIYDNSERSLEARVLIGMRDTMIHRGPDDAGIFLTKDRRVGLGHRRLSIVDISPAGHQPMCNEDGSVWVVFNGEIYNHRELRKGLEGKGHTYKSNSDTETILHLYEEKGEDCVTELDGEFAFALWDQSREQLLFVRDRLGVKPLYFAFHQGVCLFGSEIKAILAYPGFGREINEEALYHYLTFLCVPSPLTLFQGIQKMKAGHVLVIRKGGKVSESCYWDPLQTQPAEDYSEGACIEMIQHLLTEATRKRMMSDVPFGAFLSGGIDSSTNVALMSQLLNSPVNTFTVALQGQEHGPHNETGFAQKIAKQFGTNHHELFINDDDIFHFLSRMTYYADDPTASTIAISQFFVSKLAREYGVIVAQVGEGSDEIFGGYERYSKLLHSYHNGWSSYQKLPHLARRLMYLAAKPWVSGNRREVLRKLARDQEMFWGYEIIFTETDKEELLTPSFRKKLNGLDSYQPVAEYYRRFNDARNDGDYLQKMMYVDLKIHLAERMLMRVDKMSMAASVEARVPFLDHKLVEFAMGIPYQVKIKDQPKYILKKAVEGLIPHDLIYRKKAGFLNPLRLLNREAVKHYFYDVVFQSGLRERKYFNYEYLGRLVDSPGDWEGTDYRQFENILILSLWHRQWIENKGVSV